jgi:hypothetical protein
LSFVLFLFTLPTSRLRYLNTSLAVQALTFFYHIDDHFYDNTTTTTHTLVIMQYFAALPLVASLVAAQGDMKIMSLAPAAAAGPMTHTVRFPNFTFPQSHISFHQTNTTSQVVVGGLKPVETGMAPFLGYTPESITANLGDTVSFVFMQKNHTATQSTFAEPCKKMEGGADSGFMPNPEGKAGVAWDFKVESTEALCK